MSRRAGRTSLYAACLLGLAVAMALAPHAGAVKTLPEPRAETTKTLRNPEGARQLTKLGQTSRSAYVSYRAGVRRAPSQTARRFTRLRLKTSEGTDERVLALEEVLGSDGKMWVRVRLPLRPNGQTGWVPRAALSNYRRTTGWLQISRRRRIMRLLRRGKVIFSAPVGLGRPIWPTPRGSYYIRSRLQGFPNSPAYGPLVFGTSAMSVLSDWPGGGVIGIHGTNQPGLIPGYISHGCIRLRNRDVLRLGRLMAVGTPLTIL